MEELFKNPAALFTAFGGVVGVGVWAVRYIVKKALKDIEDLKSSKFSNEAAKDVKQAVNDLKQSKLSVDDAYKVKADLEKDIGEVKEDVHELKDETHDDVKDLRDDIEHTKDKVVPKESFEELRQDVRDLNQTVARLNESLDNRFASASRAKLLETQITQLQDNISKLDLEVINHINQVVDSFKRDMNERLELLAKFMKKD